MLLHGEGFPFEPLSDEAKLQVRSSCGVLPPEHAITDPDYFWQFSKLSGLRLLQSGQAAIHTQFFNGMARRTARALDVDASAGSRFFNRGLLFYAGVLQTATQATEIPIEDDVLIHLRDDEDIIIAAGEGLTAIECTVTAVNELLDDAKTAMGTDQDVGLHQMTKIGAGMLHLVVVESLQRSRNPDPLTLDEAHPELADLANLTDTLFGTQG